MIQKIKLENIYDPGFEEVYDLYTASFPTYARRSWAELASVFSKKQNFNCCSLRNEDGFVGLICYWNFEKFVYIEHLAILPDLRNKGLGTEFIKAFIKENELPLVVETETPRTQIASQRIHFYERAGFYMISNFYMQPPYEGGQVLMSMLIMTTDYHYVNKHFNTIKNAIYKEVYKFDPKKKL